MRSGAEWLGVMGVLLAGMGLTGIIRGRGRYRGFVAITGFALTAPWFFLQFVQETLDGFRPLAGRRQAGEIRFERIGKRRYLAALRLRGEPYRKFELAGDEWQLDVRIVVWGTWANWLGLQPSYRFERLSGRYENVADETRASRTVYALTDSNQPAPWIFRARQRTWIPGMEAYYGNATFLPMKDGARYVIGVNRTGIAAYPDNPAATHAVNQWGRRSGN